MNIQTINIGSAANDGTGDSLRTAFQKANSNFAPAYGNFVTNSDDAPLISLTAVTAGVSYDVVGLDSLEGSVAPYVTMANSKFTIGASGGGLYLVQFAMSLDSSANTAIVHVDATKNGDHVDNVSSDVRFSSGADQRTISAVGLVPLLAGDVVGLHFRSSVNNTIIGFRHCSFLIHRIA